MQVSSLGSPVGRVLAAASAIEVHGGPVPTDELAALAGCSSRQLQRDFADVLGVGPRQYGASVRCHGGRRALQRADSVLDAVHEAGYGSVRAFYEGTARRLGMSPTEYARGGPDRPLLWSWRRCCLGDVIAVAAPQGLCAVRIGDQAALVAEIEQEFRSARLVRDDEAMSDVMDALTRLALGLDAAPLPVSVAGTAFQARVWAALREIPPGSTRTYTQVAAAIGQPRAARAVAAACAANPVAIAVPCHRVIRSDGSPAGYRWGLSVKLSLLASEGRQPRDEG